MRKSMKYLIAYYMLFVILFFPLCYLYNQIDYFILKTQLKRAVVVLLESNCKERVNVLHVEIKNEWFAGTVWKAETDSLYITKVSGRYADNGVSADLQSLYAKESERSICNFNNNDLYFLDRFNNEFIRSNNTMQPLKVNLIGISLITIGLIGGVVIFALIELRSKSSR
jgi:hypothetical protein